MKERTERRLWESAKLGRGLIAIGVVLFVAGTTINIQNLAKEIRVSAEVDTDNLSRQLSNLTEEQRNTTNQLENITTKLENMGKIWHLTYREETLGDWMGPFYLHGEKALVSWMPTESIIQEGEEAQFCHAHNRACLDLFVKVGNIAPLNLSSEGDLDEGWYYLYYTPMTGANKAIEVYLYY